MIFFRTQLLNVLLLATCSFGTPIIGQEPEVKSLPNLKVPTLGGKQFWTDHQWFFGWRLQQNAVTGHWRLIDSQNVRHAWGSRAACQKILDREIAESDVRPLEHVVVLMHGLFRSSQSMASLGDYLQQQGCGEPVLFEYASSRDSIANHAAALREVIEGLPGKPTVHLVGHSMGNIVARHAIGDWLRNDPGQILPRLKRFVMLGPPNQGAAIARHLGKLKLYELIAGKGGMELGLQWQQLESHLATPPCPFAIVAGNIENPAITNPLVEGDSDFVVSVDEAKLAGADEELIVPVLHSFLMSDPKVQAATARFLLGQKLASN